MCSPRRQRHRRSDGDHRRRAQADPGMSDTQRDRRRRSSEPASPAPPWRISCRTTRRSSCWSGNRRPACIRRAARRRCSARPMGTAGTRADAREPCILRAAAARLRRESAALPARRARDWHAEQSAQVESDYEAMRAFTPQLQLLDEAQMRSTGAGARAAVRAGRIVRTRRGGHRRQRAASGFHSRPEAARQPPGVRRADSFHRALGRGVVARGRHARRATAFPAGTAAHRRRGCLGR